MKKEGDFRVVVEVGLANLRNHPFYEFAKSKVFWSKKKKKVGQRIFHALLRF